MAFGLASSQTPEAVERRAEGRLLNALKGALREAVSALQERENLTQKQAADKLGCDAGFLSRTLSPDFHVNSRTLAQIMHRAGGEWVIGWCPAYESQCQARLQSQRFRVASATSDSVLSVGHPHSGTKTQPAGTANGAVVGVKEVNVFGSRLNKATGRLLVA